MPLHIKGSEEGFIHSHGVVNIAVMECVASLGTQVRDRNKGRILGILSNLEIASESLGALGQHHDQNEDIEAPTDKFGKAAEKSLLPPGFAVVQRDIIFQFLVHTQQMDKPNKGQNSGSKDHQKVSAGIGDAKGNKEADNTAGDPGDAVSKGQNTDE